MPLSMNPLSFGIISVSKPPLFKDLQMEITWDNVVVLVEKD
jgi:hypothetical protein